MAISKSIVSDNGVPVEYHRIVAIHMIPSNSILVEIGSYINQSARLSEKEALSAKEMDNENHNKVLVEGFLEILPYKETLSISEIYSEIKKLDKYKDSIDV